MLQNDEEKIQQNLDCKIKCFHSMVNVEKKINSKPMALKKNNLVSNVDDQLSTYLWDTTMKQGLQNEALQTNFIQGIKNGTLNPDDYGGLTIQDVAYCYYGAQNWKDASLKALKLNQILVGQFCEARYESYETFVESFSKEWNISMNGIKGIELSKEAQDYINDEELIIKNYDSSYCIIANYACYKLWPWLAEKMSPYQNSDVYKVWIQNNTGYSSAIKLENEMDMLYEQGKLDKDLSLKNCNVMFTKRNKFFFLEKVANKNH